MVSRPRQAFWIQRAVRCCRLCGVAGGERVLLGWYSFLKNVCTTVFLFHPLKTLTTITAQFLGTILTTTKGFTAVQLSLRGY